MSRRARMPEPEQIIAALGHDELLATDLSRIFGVHLYRLYELLVSMEARGLLRVMPRYIQSRSTSCAWRAA